MGVREILLGLGFAAGCLGCVEMGVKRVAAVAGADAAAQVGCVLLKSRSQRQLAAAVKLEVRPAADFCTNAANYRCTLRRFSPEVMDDKVTRDECAEVPALGGKACVNVTAYSFNTRDAAKSSGLDEKLLEPGGDYNHNEYVCHHVLLKDGEKAIAGGEASTLADALARMHDRCGQFIPFLSER